MHGFDIMQRAKATQAALNERIGFMRRFFLWGVMINILYAM